MKSGIVTNNDYVKDKGSYTELMVLRSNAGWYIGTLYNNPEGFQEPGSRDSDYYGTEEKARAALKLMTALGEEVAHSVMRQAP